MSASGAMATQKKLFSTSCSKKRLGRIPIREGGMAVFLRRAIPGISIHVVECVEFVQGNQTVYGMMSTVIAEHSTLQCLYMFGYPCYVRGGHIHLHSHRTISESEHPNLSAKSDIYVILESFLRFGLDCSNFFQSKKFRSLNCAHQAQLGLETIFSTERIVHTTWCAEAKSRGITWSWDHCNHCNHCKRCGGRSISVSPLIITSMKLCYRGLPVNEEICSPSWGQTKRIGRKQIPALYV